MNLRSVDKKKMGGVKFKPFNRTDKFTFRHLII